MSARPSRWKSQAFRFASLVLPPALAWHVVFASSQRSHLSDAVISHLVRRTEGMADREKNIPFSGDHLQSVCRALKRQSLRTGSGEFTADDIDRALQRKTRRAIVLSREEERVIGLHEAGHALLAMLLPKATPPERICISQDQDGALGYVLRAARARPRGGRARAAR